jgi:hypothetical protein
MPLAIALLSHRPLYAQHVLFSSVAAHFSFIKEPAEVIHAQREDARRCSLCALQHIDPLE